MGFRKDAYAKVWKIKQADGKRYAEAELSVSKKNKETGTYETTFSSKFVRFVGSAYEQIGMIKEGDRIKLSSCDVESWYNKDSGKGGVTFLVFGFEPADGAASGTGKPASAPAANTPDDEEDPF